MKDLIKNKAFRIGFAITTCLHVGLNICIYLFLLHKFYHQEDERFTTTMTIHLIYNVGFPFPMYFWTDYSHDGHIIWEGIILNILSLIIFSFIIGLIFKFVWSEFTSKQLR
jgi:hypothetical protein